MPPCSPHSDPFNLFSITVLSLFFFLPANVTSVFLPSFPPPISSPFYSLMPFIPLCPESLSSSLVFEPQERQELVVYSCLYLSFICFRVCIHITRMSVLFSGSFFPPFFPLSYIPSSSASYCLHISASLYLSLSIVSLPLSSGPTVNK